MSARRRINRANPAPERDFTGMVDANGNVFNHFHEFALDHGCSRCPACVRAARGNNAEGRGICVWVQALGRGHSTHPFENVCGLEPDDIRVLDTDVESLMSSPIELRDHYMVLSRIEMRSICPEVHRRAEIQRKLCLQRFGIPELPTMEMGRFMNSVIRPLEETLRYYEANFNHLIDRKRALAGDLLLARFIAGLTNELPERPSSYDFVFDRPSGDFFTTNFRTPGSRPPPR